MCAISQNRTNHSTSLQDRGTTPPWPRGPKPWSGFQALVHLTQKPSPVLSHDLIISLRRFLYVLIVCTVGVLGELLKNEICLGKLHFICKDVIIKTSYLCPLAGKSRGIDTFSFMKSECSFIGWVRLI